MKLNVIAVMVIFALTGLWALPASATWSQDPAVNNPVCTEIEDQSYLELVSDDDGGVIFCWRDRRFAEPGGTYNGTFFAQRMNADGIAQWGNDGIAVCTSNDVMYEMRMISDDAGGAIIVWLDARNSQTDVYAQRLSADGTPLWTSDGIGICTASGIQSHPYLTSDGAGGAIIVWTDSRNSSITGRDIYAQRVNSNGVTQWAADGVPVCMEAEDQHTPRPVSDGADGAIITWSDGRSLESDIYAQRVDGQGVMQWTTDGVEICTAADDQIFSKLVSDGSGGAIIGWGDHRVTDEDRYYLQKVSTSGTVQWAADGVPVTIGAENTVGFAMVPDNTGGAVISWVEIRNGNYAIYAQLVTNYGAPRWPGDGAEINVAASNQSGLNMARDEAGGVIISWIDDRSVSLEYDIYAQRVEWSGAVQWAANGIAVCNATGSQFKPRVVSDGAGGAIIGWNDQRHGETDEDIYAQWVDGNGYPGGLETINAGLGCLPCSGIAPFSTRFRATMYNLLDDQYRQVAGRINILLANGTQVNNWRSGFTTLSPGETYNTSWYTTIPATGSVIGQNGFTLELEDITQAPYNQPPYMPSGDTDRYTVTVTATAP